MTANELVLNAQLTTHTANLVFEKAAQGFNQLELHIVGQTANIMVGLDGLRGALDRAGLNDIGVDGALSQPLGIGNQFGFGVEHINESLADGFAFLLGVGNSCKDRIETVFGINAFYIEAHIAIGLQHTFELVFAKQAVVDKDAMQLMTDGTVEQHRSYSGVNTAGETQHHLVAANLGTKLVDGGFDKRLGSP